MNWIARLIGSQNSAGATPPRRARVELPTDIRTVYAIGDVHGRFDLLLKMHNQIILDDLEKDTFPTIILLGDMIDRGPKSAQIIDWVLETKRLGNAPICLLGNHELAMCEFLSSPHSDAPWLAQGGFETLMSYGFDAARKLSRREFANGVTSVIPNDHRTFLQGLPSAAHSEHWFFSHAGIDPARTIADQRDSDLVWFRDGMENDYGRLPKIVVHGHQVVAEPVVKPKRINVDTGAYATGRLSAVKLSRSEYPRVFSVQ